MKELPTTTYIPIPIADPAMREAAAISVERRAIAVHAWRVQSAVRAYLELTGGKLADNAEEEQERRAVCAL